jgi:hypothetical protein
MDRAARALENFVAAYEPSGIDVTVEHSDVAKHDIRKASIAIDKLGERLLSAQHQTELSICVDEIRQ